MAFYHPGSGRNRPGQASPLGSGGRDARERAMLWARQIVTDPAVLYLDTETTGTSADAEVVEISIVDAGGGVLLDTLVRHVGDMDPGAQRVHRIAAGDLAQALEWPDVYGTLRGLITGRPVVVYNAAFDGRIIDQCCQRHAVASLSVEWHCAMLRYAEFQQEPGRFPGKFRWHKLEVAAASFGARPGDHRALSDARACRHVVAGMAGAPNGTDVHLEND